MKLCAHRTDFAEIESNIQHHVTLAALLIKDVAKINNTVSPWFQIGVHRLDAGKAVSEICKNGSLSLHFEH